MAVLLVEHYLPLARPLVRGLEEEGIVVDLATNDAEGDERVRGRDYAAVVVDWKVPRAGGLALVRRWRQAGLTVPIVLLMPAEDEADRRRAAEAGADAVLPLPFAFDDLLASLRAWERASRAPLPGDALPPACRWSDQGWQAV